MKKKIVLTCIVILAGISGVALALGGSSNDPLISLEYVTKTFQSTLMEQVEQQLSDTYGESYGQAEQKLEKETDSVRTQLGGDSDSWRYYANFTTQKYKKGDTLTLNSGSSLLFLEGEAEATAKNGEVIDVTNASAATQSTLGKNRRYLVGEDATVTVTVRSDAAKLSMAGYYQMVTSGQTATPFTDLSQGVWYYAPVQYVYQKKLLNGVSEDHFEPSGTVTRAMLATILYRLAGEPSVSGTINVFTDVSSGQWYEKGITWSSASGIVNGMGNGLFQPERNLTREEFAVMLYRYATDYAKLETEKTGDLNSFTDCSMVSAWAETALSWAVGVGIMNGDTNGALHPKGSATRAEAATMLERFCKLIP